MNILTEIECNLFELQTFTINLADKAKIGDIFFLKGDLGVGKTTFARFFINSLYDKYKVKREINIKSPSYPILINYPFLNYEILHYDFYRIKKENEILEIGFFENLKKNISIIEWPEIIIDNFKINNYYSLSIEIIDLEKRKIKLQYCN